MVDLYDYNRLPWFWDVLESNRPATNLPLGSVGSNQVYRMVEKSALVVKNRGADLMGASGWTLLRPCTH